MPNAHASAACGLSQRPCLGHARACPTPHPCKDQELAVVVPAAETLNQGNQDCVSEVAVMTANIVVALSERPLMDGLKLLIPPERSSTESYEVTKLIQKQPMNQVQLCQLEQGESATQQSTFVQASSENAYEVHLVSKWTYFKAHTMKNGDEACS